MTNTHPPAPPVEPMEDDFRRLSPLTPVARSAVFLAAAGIAAGRQLVEERRFGFAALAVLVVLVAGGVFGFASWWRTRYRISATELRIDTGVLNQRSRRVRLDRIQEIGVNQPFAARVLGLAELKIETAATSDAEVTLAYLPLAEAHDVRRVLLEQRDEVLEEESPEGESPRRAAQAEPRLLLRVPIAWQVKGVLASPETVGLVLVALVIAGLVTLAGVPFGAFGIGVATFLGAGASLFRKVVGWWDWRVSALPTGIQVRHGMFSVRTRTFNVARLQGVRVTEPVLQRPFGLARLDLSVAGGVADKGESEGSDVALPVAPRDLVWRLAADLLGTDPATVRTTAPPSRASWLRPLSRPWLAFGLDDRLVVSRTGWLTRRTQLVPLARVQSFRVRQGPLQRGLRLASVYADCPVGVASVAGPHRDPADAGRLVTTGVERARAARLPPRTVDGAVTGPTRPLGTGGDEPGVTLGEHG